MKVLVTGATGFVGRHVVEFLQKKNFEVVGLSRSSSIEGIGKTYILPDINAVSDWSDIMEGVDVVIHLAAANSAGKDVATQDWFDKVNYHATKCLSHAARKNGVKRFIFLSSLKAYGDSSGLNSPITIHTVPRPASAYGKSKLKAQKALYDDFKNDEEFGVIIIVPPLIYGPGVKGNFIQMIRAVERSIPLPLRDVKNQRSLLSVNNLVSFIDHCITKELAGSKVYFISDGQKVSTPEIIELIAKGLGRRPLLFKVPQAALSSLFKLLGRGHFTERLFGSYSLETNISKEEWTPPFNVYSEIYRMMHIYSSKNWA